MNNRKNGNVFIIIIILCLIGLMLAGPLVFYMKSESNDATTTNGEKDNSLAVGNVITLGKYEWQILSINDEKALIISTDKVEKAEYLIGKEYNSDLTWENSYLRSWLNDEFYNEFDLNEREVIEIVHLDNDDNSQYGSYGGNDTEDYIFVLSIDEANEFFLTNEDRSITYYTWWLRSPGMDNQFAAVVKPDGSIDQLGEKKNLKFFVRPALWIDIDRYEKLNLALSLEKTADTSADDAVTSTSCKDYSDLIGNIVKFGKYEQDGDIFNGKEDITWKIINIEGDNALLISTEVLDSKPYNYDSQNINWKESSLRKWLNADFFVDAFSTEEQGSIKAKEDKVFLLTEKEVSEYLGSDRLCLATRYARDIGLENSLRNEVTWWILSENEPWVVDYYGAIKPLEDIMFDYYANDSMGVRPSILVSVSELIYKHINASIYENDELGFTIEIPEIYIDEVSYRETFQGVTFVLDKGIEQTDGELFSIYVVPEEKYEMDYSMDSFSCVNIHELKRISGYVYYIGTPKDVEYTLDTKDLYEKCISYYDDIANSFTFIGLPDDIRNTQIFSIYNDFLSQNEINWNLLGEYDIPSVIKPEDIRFGIIEMGIDEFPLLILQSESVSHAEGCIGAYSVCGGEMIQLGFRDDFMEFFPKSGIYSIGHIGGGYGETPESFYKFDSAMGKQVFLASDCVLTKDELRQILGEDASLYPCEPFENYYINGYNNSEIYYGMSHDVYMSNATKEQYDAYFQDLLGDEFKKPIQLRLVENTHENREKYLNTNKAYKELSYDLNGNRKVTDISIIEITADNDWSMNIRFEYKYQDKSIISSFKGEAFGPSPEVISPEDYDFYACVKSADIDADGEDEILIKTYYIYNSLSSYAGELYIFHTRGGELIELAHIDSLDGNWMCRDYLVNGELYIESGYKMNANCISTFYKYIPGTYIEPEYVVIDDASFLAEAECW